MANILVYSKDFSAQANTTIHAGPAPFVGSATVGGGTGYTDRGNQTTGLATHNVQGGILSNTRVNGPGAFEFPGNGLVYDQGTIQDGEAWVENNIGQNFGIVMRNTDTSPLAGVGAYFNGTDTFYFFATRANANTNLFNANSVGVTIPSQYRMRLRVVNNGGTLSLLGELYTTAVDPANPELSAPLYSIIYNYNISPLLSIPDLTSYNALIGAGRAGVASFGGGEATKMWGYTYPAGLQPGTAKLKVVAKTAVYVEWTAASGSAAAPTYALYNGATLLASNIQVSPTTIDSQFVITGLTPSTTYNLIVKANDGVDTVDYNTLTCTTLNANAVVIGVVGDSNLDDFFGISSSLKAPKLFNDWLIANGQESVITNYAQAGTTVSNWSNLGAGIFSQKYSRYFVQLGVTDYIFMLGTNDAKTPAVSTGTYETHRDALQTEMLAGLSNTARVWYADIPYINPSAASWDAASNPAVQGYNTSNHAKATLSAVDRVYSIDTSFNATSLTNVATYFPSNDVHLNSTGHTNLALAWQIGWAANFPNASAKSPGTIAANGIDITFQFTPGIRNAPQALSLPGGHTASLVTTLPQNDGVDILYTSAPEFVAAETTTGTTVNGVSKTLTNNSTVLGPATVAPPGVIAADGVTLTVPYGVGTIAAPQAILLPGGHTATLVTALPTTTSPLTYTVSPAFVTGETTAGSTLNGVALAITNNSAVLGAATAVPPIVSDSTGAILTLPFSAGTISAPQALLLSGGHVTTLVTTLPSTGQELEWSVSPALSYGEVVTATLNAVAIALTNNAVLTGIQSYGNPLVFETDGSLTVPADPGSLVPATFVTHTLFYRLKGTNGNWKFVPASIVASKALTRIQLPPRGSLEVFLRSYASNGAAYDTTTVTISISQLASYTVNEHHIPEHCAIGEKLSAHQFSYTMIFGVNSGVFVAPSRPLLQVTAQTGALVLTNASMYCQSTNISDTSDEGKRAFAPDFGD